MNNADGSANLRARRVIKQLPPGDRDKKSATTSAADGQMSNGIIHNSTVSLRPPDEMEQVDMSMAAALQPLNEDERRHVKGERPHRSHKRRPVGSSNTFLLSDPIFDAPDPGQDPNPRALSHRWHRHISDNPRPKTTSNTTDRSSSSGHSSKGLAPTDTTARPSTETELTGTTAATTATLVGDAAPRASNSSPAVNASTRVSLDMDSAQIVNMALNLSESRRLAARRNASQPLPPRLAPLPADNATGGSLRQHLQQQRRISRTISPRPGSRLVSGQKVTSPLQAAFDPGSEGAVRYHFSQSTLARAQKAKDYLELLAQYRKLVDLLPPLKPDKGGRFVLSRPGSAGNRGQNGSAKLGRPYNPLQYIRNRKVRARERKAIDGEGQGFNDVYKVTEWVSEVAKRAASSEAQPPEGKPLPPFASADEAALQSSPPSASRPGVGIVKSKRPRVDWVIDPADMLADAYWLEQGDRKKLVEDRHWRRVFPQDSGLYNAMPAPPEKVMSEIIIPEDKEGSVAPILPTDTSLSEPKPPRAEHEHLLSSTRDRAQQKLRALKGVHHRHNSSLYGRDLLRMKRGSLSDSSDTDSDRRRARSGTSGGNDKMILEKQMLDMIAQEQRDRQFEAVRDPGMPFKSVNASLMTPERERPRFSPVPSRQPSHSRQQSKAELSELDRKISKTRPQQMPASPVIATRTSLEVPQWGRRPSIDDDTSLPTSPEMRPVRENIFVPAIGMDLSPTTSRPGSPTRNPFSKVKSIFRDRSRERTADFHAHQKDNSPPILLSDERLAESATLERRVSPDRRGSTSPARKLAFTGTDIGYKTHRANTTGHMKTRGEDSGAGLRGLFRGPRIDTVIRSGVSKVGDMIWRRDADAGDTSGTSSDESGVERRGRSRGSAVPSRAASRRRDQELTSRHYLNIMPHFLHPPEHGKSSAGDQNSRPMPGALPPSRPHSRRSPRFDKLKPPRLEVQDPLSPATPPPEVARRLASSDVSDADSRKSSRNGNVRQADARLNAMLSMPHRRFSAQTTTSRHWSISMREEKGLPVHRPVSKFEVARMRTLVMSRGIMAMEIERRAKERKPLNSPTRISRKALPSTPPRAGEVTDTDTDNDGPGKSSRNVFSWPSILDMCPDPEFKEQIRRRPIAQTEVYPLAARILGQSIQSAAQRWQASADSFSTEASRSLQRRVNIVRDKANGLSDLTRAAADEADEVSRDLVTGQRLKIKRVVDVMDKMLRRRRRRFRWVRRAGWLAVEWVLVGFMWYVWFVVMIARIFLGVGKGLLRGMRWLLWL